MLSMRRKTVNLRALCNLCITDDGFITGSLKDMEHLKIKKNIIKEVKEGEVFEIDKDIAKSLKDFGFAQAPSRYVNKGLRISRKQAIETMEAIDKIKKALSDLSGK